MNLYRLIWRLSDAFLPKNGRNRAIHSAKQAGMRLKIAAKAVDRDYFTGVAGGSECRIPGGDQRTTEEPIDSPEPFGLSMIEAMACGTPTIAFCRGSVPEVIDDGITGFIVGNEDEAVKAWEPVSSVSRARFRATFECRFTACRMAKEYLSIYEALADEMRQSHTVSLIELSTTVLS
jgi:hypothetical protein